MNCEKNKRGGGGGISNFNLRPCPPGVCRSFMIKRSIVVMRAKYFQTELMFEICSESLVRAIGTVLLKKFS